MDIAAIAERIAYRFSILVPPTGYQAIQKSTPRRQSTVGKLPVAETAWVNTRDLDYFNYQRGGIADFTTTVLFPKGKDEDATDAMLQAWHDVLIDALLGELQLSQWGTSNGVKGAYVKSVTPGEDQRGEPYLAALAVAIEVEFRHPVNMQA